MKQPPTGITSAEAKILLQKWGKNEITKARSIKILPIFISQFANILVVLLIVAAVVSYSFGDQLDAFFIFLIILLNALLGFFQEYKAENTLRKLKDLSSAKTRVIRDGNEQLVDSTVLVPGDYAILNIGDKVPADGVCIMAQSLEINEAALTGESLPVSKSDQGGIQSALFMGSIVTNGKAILQITSTGKNTRFGQIATSLASIGEEKTPLEKKITKLGIQLTVGVVSMSGIIFLIGIIQKRNIVDMVLTSVSLAVAAVPEGLPAVITIALAVGVQRMARK